MMNHDEQRKKERKKKKKEESQKFHGSSNTKSTKPWLPYADEMITPWF